MDAPTLAKFLIVLEETGSAVLAADRAGMTPDAFYKERRRNQEFRQYWDDARAAYKLRELKRSGYVGNPLEDIDLQERFLEAFKERGVKATCAELVGILVHHVDAYRKESPEFALAYDHAEAVFVDRAAETAWHDAFEGVEKPIYQGGVCVGKVREKDQAAQHRLLKSRRDEFKDSVKVDQTVNHTGGVLLVAAPAKTAEEWLARHDPKALGSGNDDG